jgi:pimeloyl-ACP methyl ester carboxylesterase
MSNSGRFFDSITHPGKPGRLHVLTEGSGPKTLVFVHGLTSSLEIWNDNTDFFAQNYHCIRLDLPGHGQSGPAETYSIPLFVAVLRQVIALHASGQKVILIGHSMGGMVSMVLAAQFPELVAQLVLVAPAGLEPFSTTEADILVRLAAGTGFQSPFFGNMLNEFKNRWKARESVETGIWASLSDNSDIKPVKTDPKLMKQCIEAMLYFPTAEYLPLILQPTLLLFGTHDKLIPNRLFHGSDTKRVAQNAVKNFQNAKLTMFPRAGHYLQRECSELFNTSVQEFVKVGHHRY